jgi:hypothetical protein
VPSIAITSVRLRPLVITGDMAAADLKLRVPLCEQADHYSENATKWFGLGADGVTARCGGGHGLV